MNDDFKEWDAATSRAEARVREQREAEAQAQSEVVEEAATGSGNPELAQLQSELEEQRDRALRTLAEFENYRKRMQRESQDQRRYAGFEILQDLLGVLDHLQLALAADGSVAELKEGVELILRDLQDLLRRHGVSRVGGVSEPFDPNVHEAVTRVEISGGGDPVVVDEHRAGYRMHERLLRPSMVTVGVPRGVPGDGEEGGGSPA